MIDPVAIAAGAQHTCAVRLGGQVLCWGQNSSGQLGEGTMSSLPEPVPVTGLGNGAWCRRARPSPARRPTTAPSSAGATTTTASSAPGTTSSGRSPRPSPSAPTRSPPAARTPAPSAARGARRRRRLRLLGIGSGGAARRQRRRGPFAAGADRGAAGPAARSRPARCTAARLTRPAALWCWGRGRAGSSAPATWSTRRSRSRSRCRAAPTRRPPSPAATPTPACCVDAGGRPRRRDSLLRRQQLRPARRRHDDLAPDARAGLARRRRRARGGGHRRRRPHLRHRRERRQPGAGGAATAASSVTAPRANQPTPTPVALPGGATVALALGRRRAHLRGRSGGRRLVLGGRRSRPARARRRRAPTSTAPTAVGPARRPPPASRPAARTAARASATPASGAGAPTTAVSSATARPSIVRRPRKVAGASGAVSAGALHSCAVGRRRTSSRCWGADTSGQLGDGVTLTISAPELARSPASERRASETRRAAKQAQVLVSRDARSRRTDADGGPVSALAGRAEGSGGAAGRRQRGYACAPRAHPPADHRRRSLRRTAGGGVPVGANAAVLDDGLVSSQHARLTRGRRRLRPRRSGQQERHLGRQPARRPRTGRCACATAR